MPLRWSLLAMLAPVGIATRGKAHAASSVMDKITALLQARQVDPGAGGEASQDAMATFQGALSVLIDELQKNVQDKIIAGHDFTNTEIATRIGSLQTATDKLIAEKASADSKDNAWLVCVGEEVGLLKDVETAETNLLSSRSSKNEACNAQEDARDFSFSVVPEEVLFECDISESAYLTCQIQWDAYKSDIEKMYNENFFGPLGLLEEASEAFVLARKGCTDATNDEAQKQSALNSEEDAYRQKRLQCQGLHEPRRVAVCAFETAYTSKCNAVTSYNDLRALIDAEDGTEYSHPDRVQEWGTAAVTKCMITAITEGAMITQESLDTCTASVDFSRDVGELDLQQSKFDELTSTANFNCAYKVGGEKEMITFNSKTWDLPSPDQFDENNVPKSDEYKERDYTPALDTLPVDFQCTGAPGK